MNYLQYTYWAKRRVFARMKIFYAYKDLDNAHIDAGYCLDRIDES